MPKFTIMVQEWQMQEYEGPDGNWEERPVLTADEEFVREFADEGQALRWCEENSSDNGDWGVNCFLAE